MTDDGALGDAARHELGRDNHWAAPEHLVIESFAAVRGLAAGSKISASRATDAVRALDQITVEAVDSTLLLARMWSLRHNISGYDAACVAAAEAHRCPLVTADVRLARADGPRCEIRLALP